MEGSKRILIFNVNWLGDVLFSTATIRNIRRNFPESYIACVIPSSCYLVLKGNPHLDEIIIFDEKDRHKSMISRLNFVKLLKSKKFDMVFLLHRSLTRALICRLAGIPKRIGYYTKKRGFLLTKKITMPKIDTIHRIDFYLNIIEKAGLKVEDRYAEFFITHEDEDAVGDFLKKNHLSGDDFVAVLNPGGNWSPKRWPKEYWGELADMLVTAFKARIILSGSQNDLNLANQIKKIMKEEPIIACGVLNLKQLAALARRSDLFITGDTGPLHIANAIGAKRIIALFGPTSPSLTGPFPVNNTIVIQKDVNCKIPCYQVNCKDNRCMKAIIPKDVMAEAKNLLR